MVFEMKGKKGIYLLIGIVAVAIITMVMFLLTPQRGDLFWIVYGFAVLGIAVVTLSVVGMRGDDRHFAANLTQVTVSVVYLLANIFCSILTVPLLHATKNAVLATHIGLFGIFLIVLLLARLAVEHINSQDK